MSHWGGRRSVGSAVSGAVLGSVVTDGSYTRGEDSECVEVADRCVVRLK